MLKPRLKRILQIAGTLALVALVVIVCRRTDWSKSFSPDGDLTLVAAVIAFIAIIIQIRSSSKQVQDQIKAQRDAEREEQERQKRAVATAILFEIDLIYRSMIRDTGEAIRNEKAVGGEFVVKPHSLHFAVYEGNAGKIGQLPASIGQDIVEFYGSATRFVITLQAYSDAVRNAHEAPSNIDWKGMASQYREHTVKAIPWVRLLSYMVSRRLCEYTGVEFRAPHIAVAADNLEQLQKECRQAEGAGAQPNA
jgi:hypothetical protein